MIIVTQYFFLSLYIILVIVLTASQILIVVTNFTNFYHFSLEKIILKPWFELIRQKVAELTDFKEHLSNYRVSSCQSTYMVFAFHREGLFFYDNLNTKEGI